MSSRGHEYTANEQTRKSVFDRLGRQLATSTPQRTQMNRRPPSPRPYDEQAHMQKPPMSEPEFAHYGSRETQIQAELEWHYQNERRSMAPPGKERHHQPMAMGPPYQMEMMNRPAYFPPHMGAPYHDGPPIAVMPMMGQTAMPMGMHQRRDMQKYDRLGNIVGSSAFKDRPGPMRMVPMGPPHPMGTMSPPPPNFMPGQMLPLGAHEMSPMRPTSMYGPQRWMETMDMASPHHQSRLLPPDDPYGYQGYPLPPQQPPMLNQDPSNNPVPMGPQEVPRYAKWRERRDFITNLDRETAQSSSRTDSLKSSLQQNEPKNTKNNSRNRRHNNASKQAKQQDQQQRSEKNQSGDTNQTQTARANESGKNDDFSDGEIVDDEDTSDESDVMRNINVKDETSGGSSKRAKFATTPTSRSDNDVQSTDPKRRRLTDREDYSMDYETISDEDLDDFMGDKKIPDMSPDNSKLNNLKSTVDVSNSSEIELLNALGLDWAHLVEMSKQSKGSKDSQVSGSALARFSLENYLLTLKITSNLAGPEITELICGICRK